MPSHARGHRSLLSVPALGLALLAACSTSADVPSSTYDRKGDLRELHFDANRNGRNDAVAYVTAGRIEHITLDLDEDGSIDRWDFYDAQRRLERIGFSRSNNGVMNAVAYFANGGLQRVDDPSSDSVAAVTAMARRAAGLEPSESADLTAEAVRDEMAAAAARSGTRWIVPVTPATESR